MSGKIFAKFGSAVLTAAIAVNSLAVTNVFSNAASDVYEFEDGTITGTSTTVMTEESGYSGDGYVYMKDAGNRQALSASFL